MNYCVGLSSVSNVLRADQRSAVKTLVMQLHVKGRCEKIKKHKRKI